MRTRAAMGLLCLAAVAVPLLLVLSPRPLAGLDTWHRLVADVAASMSAGRVTVSRGEAEALANLLLLVPLGFGARVLLPRTRAIWLVAGLAGFAVAVEAAQLLRAARDPAVRDIVLNTAGAALGVAAGALLRRRCRVAQAAPAPTARPQDPTARSGC